MAVSDLGAGFFYVNFSILDCVVYGFNVDCLGQINDEVTGGVFEQIGKGVLSFDLNIV